MRVCVHRGECMCVYMSACVCTDAQKNEILFCMLEQLMSRLGLPISSMLGGLFSRGVDSAPHSRERAGNRDAQSHDPKKIKANQNN